MKTTALIGLTTLLGVFIGYQIPRGIVSGTVSITTFNINVPFEKWATGFDSKEASKVHVSNELKPLFRGVSVDNPRQVVVIHQSKPGSVKQFLTDNREMIEASGHIYRSTQTSDWSSKL